MYELAVNPAESGKLAARYSLVEIAEASWREAAKSGRYPERLVTPRFLSLVDGVQVKDCMPSPVM